MRPFVPTVLAIVLANPSRVDADSFRWDETAEVTTTWVEEFGDGDLEIEHKSQMAGFAYHDVQITLTWRSYGRAMPVATIVFFGHCVGRVEPRVRGDRVVIVSKCDRYDDFVTTDTWRFNRATHAFRRVASSTVSARFQATRPIRRLLARGDVRQAYRRLEQLGPYEYSTTGEIEETWLLLFLDAARAASSADDVAFVARAPLFGADRWREAFGRADSRARAAWVLNDCAYLLYLAGETDLAIEILEATVEHAPARAVAHLNLGDAYWKSGGLDRARAEYRLHAAARRSQHRPVPKRVPDRLGEP